MSGFESNTDAHPPAARRLTLFGGAVRFGGGVAGFLAAIATVVAVVYQIQSDAKVQPKAMEVDRVLKAGATSSTLRGSMAIAGDTQRVPLGTPLCLTLFSSEPAYAMLLSEDDSGVVSIVLPGPDGASVSISQPTLEDVRTAAATSGRRRSLQMAADAPGRHRMLLVVSRSPLTLPSVPRTAAAAPNAIVDSVLEAVRTLPVSDWSASVLDVEVFLPS